MPATQRVLLEDEPETGEQFRNGTRVLLDEDRPGTLNNWVNGHDTNRVRKLKPRRNKTEVSRRLGPHSRVHSLWELDLRTREAMMMQKLKAELVQHVGGAPNVIQRVLIERACMLSLRVCQLDAKILAGEELSRHANDHALAWFNSLRRTLVELGINPAKAEATGNDLDGWVRSKSRVA